MSLIEFQRKAGLVPDGIFGKNTFNKGAEYLGIETPTRAVHFWAQVAHETAMFKRFEENLNYSEKGLLTVFRYDFDWNEDKKFNPIELEKAKQLARNPIQIANFVYANQNGNGDESSGDGWKYRGRGAIQLTGRKNYSDFAKYMMDADIVFNPDKVLTDYAFESAIFFFKSNNLWNICDRGLGEDNVKRLTKRINGGTNGLAHRIKLTNLFKEKYTDL